MLFDIYMFNGKVNKNMRMIIDYIFKMVWPVPIPTAYT